MNSTSTDSSYIQCVYKNETSSHPMLVTAHCDVCDGLESGDTLYSHVCFEDGDSYLAIRNIQFCPKCGKKLLSFREKRMR